MPQQRRLQRIGVRRIGRTATVMSAGTFVLLLAGAPAQAGVTAAKPCPAPKTPAEVPEYWKCLGKNIEDGLNPQPDPQEPEEPKPSKPPAKPKPSKPDPDKPAKPDNDGNGSTPKRTRTPNAPSGGSGGGGVTAYTRPERLRPYTPSAASTAPQLSGLLPAPQVAPGAQVSPTVGLGETRLITPVAAQQRQEDQMLWVAVASGVAGAVGAMNISTWARRMRRRPAP
ncbi:hypothetical protein SAMN04489712_108183 [Thermomonospora echinospora]|uniref:Uncharacterized protein n=1 Tax=Thermomonospora echinospora TaxID=1992 RepID=A0A1H6C063_9ACTN|nr:hypothetical protein [Thermomonospora echinospora]SEG66330.1 hypothetical protein SAMN04489712_108183 [Thermomonospora echinospora]